MGVHSGKFYDAIKMREYCDGMKEAAAVFDRNAELSHRCIAEFHATDTFKGMTANETKKFVKSGIGNMLKAVSRTHVKMIKMQTELMELFENMVDPSQNARIEYDALDLINKDFKDLYYTYKDRADNVRRLVDGLNEEFGNYAYFEQPDSQTGLDAFIDFCGGESDSAGFLFQCQQKMLAYDETAKTLIKSKDTMTKVGKINSSISSTKDALVPIGEAVSKAEGIIIDTVNNVIKNINKKNTANSTNLNVEFGKSLVDIYGFNDEEASLITQAFDNYFNNSENDLSNEEKIHMFYRNFAALHTEYSSSSKLFGNMCDTTSTENAKTFFDELGIDSDALQAAIEQQHAVCSNNGTRDMAHEAVIYATMSNSSWLKKTADYDDSIDALIGYKGDVYSARMGDDDKKADIAAVNLYQRMKNSDGDIMGAINEYNKDVNEGLINESMEFLENYGNGDTEKGMKNLIKEMDDESAGTWFLTRSYYGYGGFYGPGPYSYGDYGYCYDGQSNDIKEKREEFLQYLTEQTGISH